jgi:hypothetical protein
MRELIRRFGRGPSPGLDRLSRRAHPRPAEAYEARRCAAANRIWTEWATRAQTRLRDCQPDRYAVVWDEKVELQLE